MNMERPDELDAKAIVEKVLGIELKHADTYGGVDYRSPDGRHALEVTRITDGRKRAGRAALAGAVQVEALNVELQTCWLVFTAETQKRLKTFLDTVNPAVSELERAGESSFDAQRAALHILEKGPLSPVYLPLLRAGVERASGVPNHAHTPHRHQIHVLLGSGGSSSGSDEALRLLTDALSEKKDNPKKLRESKAEQQHLFVWVDDDTRFDIARPLSREAPTWRDEGFGLPSVPPELDPTITHLWVVHERSRRAWLWGNENWCELRDL